MRDGPALVPWQSDADGHAAIRFLAVAFGRETVQPFDGEDGAPMQGELACRNCVVMLGTGAADKRSPGLYLVVEDVDAAFGRVSAAGAHMVHPPEDTRFGIRRRRRRYPEGHTWSPCSYVPQTKTPDRG